MGQYGAKGYADGGQTAGQILDRYYGGTTPGTQPNNTIKVLLCDLEGVTVCTSGPGVNQIVVTSTAAFTFQGSAAPGQHRDPDHPRQRQQPLAGGSGRRRLQRHELLVRWRRFPRPPRQPRSGYGDAAGLRAEGPHLSRVAQVRDHRRRQHPQGRQLRAGRGLPQGRRALRDAVLLERRSPQGPGRGRPQLRALRRQPVPEPGRHLRHDPVPGVPRVLRERLPPPTRPSTRPRVRCGSSTATWPARSSPRRPAATRPAAPSPPWSTTATPRPRTRTTTGPPRCR